MKRFAVLALISLLLLSSLALLPAQTNATEANWLDGWNYRKSITIIENSGNDLTDYQVAINLDSNNFDFSKANADGSDIRFTDSDGETLLSYWIESWDSANQTAKIWVKVPNIPANGSVDIYMYYGNANAQSESDPEAVFDFWDDFDDGVLDTNKWALTDTYPSGANVTEHDGVLDIYMRRIPYTINEFPYPIVIEYKWKKDTDTYCEVGVSRYDGTSSPDLYYAPYNAITYESKISTTGYGTYFQKFVNGTRTIENINYRFSVNEWYQITFKDGKDKYATKLIVNGTEVDSRTETTTFSKNHVSPGYASEVDASHVYIDDFRIRKYADPEPCVIIGGKYTVTFHTNNPNAGISLNGHTYYNGDTVQLTNGTYTISAILSNGCIFDHWESSNLSIADAYSESTTVTVNGKNGDLYLYVATLNDYGFHRLKHTPQNWYKVVKWQGVNYSYIAFYNGYNLEGDNTLQIDYLDENFNVVWHTTGPDIQGELYPMVINNKIFLPGHDGDQAYFGTFNPATGEVTGTRVNTGGEHYLTDMIFDSATNQYFILPAYSVEFFYKTDANNIQNPSNWQKIYIPSQYVPDDAYNYEMRFTPFKRYIYIVSPTTFHKTPPSHSFLIRYNIDDGTFEEVLEIQNTAFNYIRSDYNTIAFATASWDNSTFTADYYISHDGVSFTQIFTASVDITANPEGEKQTFILPILNSQYYYVEIVCDFAQGKYFIIDENGTVYYSASVDDAAHTTIADPIMEQNRLLEGTEKCMNPPKPSNNAFIQAMTFQELPIQVSTQNNGGEEIQVHPGTVIYAIEPYNNALGMFYKCFNTTQTVYINSDVPYHIGQIVQEHGNYVLIEPEQEQYTVTFYTNVTGATITVNGQTYSNGEQAEFTNGQYTVTANPPDGYEFDHWVTVGITVSNYNAQTTTMIIDGCGGSLSARFVPATEPQYTVTFHSNHADAGIILNGHTYYSGDTVQLTNGTYSISAVVPSGYTFDHWEVANLNVANTHSETTTMTVNGKDGDLYLYVTTAEEKQYTITFQANTNGLPWSVTIGENTYNSNTNTIVVSLPNGTYSYIVHPPDGYSATPESGSFTVNGADLTISITFTQIEDNTNNDTNDTNNTTGSGGAGDTNTGSSSDILENIKDFADDHPLTVVFAALAIISLLAGNRKAFIIFVLLALASYFMIDPYTLQGGEWQWI